MAAIAATEQLIGEREKVMGHYPRITAISLVLLTFSSSAFAADELMCPPSFVSHDDQLICAVANYGDEQDVTIEMYDGRNGELVEPVLEATLDPLTETGIHHNVVPPSGKAPAHPVLCIVTVEDGATARASFTRLARAAADDGDFEATDAKRGGEAVECR